MWATCVATVAACAVLSAGCTDRGAVEARGISQAFAAFEGASPTDRPAALSALRSTPCNEADACAARDACVAYATAFVRARELMDKAHALGPEDSGGNGAASESERAIIVSGAQDALHDAEDAEPRCHQGLEKLRLRASKK